MNKELLNKARTILSQAQSVVVFSGAGLSAESGIATFRGNDPDAYWSRFDPLKLASVQGFAEAPGTVTDWYNWRRKQLAEARPNPAHQALATQTGLINITQNVDDLLERAGVPAANILHLHGSILKDRCHAACGHEETVSLTAPPGLHSCVHCGASMRPAVVWFGEMLPQQTWHKAMQVCRETDCLLVVGTSGSVYPAASLVELAQRSGAEIIVVNPESGRSGGLELKGQAGEILPALLAGLTLAGNF